MFAECSSLCDLPDISKFNTSKIIDMSYMFCYCSSLSVLPNISKWNFGNVKNVSWMFFECSSLSSLPDYSKFNNNNIIKDHMFDGCKNNLLTNIPKSFIN